MAEASPTGRVDVLFLRAFDVLAKQYLPEVQEQLRPIAEEIAEKLQPKTRARKRT